MTTITQAPYLMTDLGQSTLYTMRNKNGMQVSATDFGGHLVSVLAPDRDGKLADVILGYGDYTGYKVNKYYLGAAVGRCANRIGKGRFTLNGKEYQLALNDNGVNHLHGGTVGFDQKLWAGKVISCEEGQALRLRLVSPDGEEHYPGALSVTMTYTLTDRNELVLHYEAASDADTVCNLTNHAYFNLAGHNSGTILGQQLKIYADHFTEADAESIPTGRVLPVEGTPMDFRDYHRVGERIDADYLPLNYGGGYDHNWVLNSPAGELGPCAEMWDEASGRHMTCLTTLPGVQFYSGNFIDGTQLGKEGCYYEKRGGLCLETQFAPDSVNHPEWPNPVLRAGELYDHTTIYRFDVK